MTKMSEHLFPYKWTLKDAKFTKDKGKVFSCFACGGGSTMGYKLAGFDVLGCNEIDPKMMACYVENHKPKFSFLEPIQDFKRRENLPDELFELDILDGSPPCSSFSMVGNRKKDWGKEKVFREGQAMQVLDTLFFDFIELGKILQPKIIVAENVKGLLLGEAKSYVIQIYKDFYKAGYVCQHVLLDASKMGVPQKRERVFFIAIRNDIAKKFPYEIDFFNASPQLDFEFKEKNIPYKYIKDGLGRQLTDHLKKLWDMRKDGDLDLSKSRMRIDNKELNFGTKYLHDNKVCLTLTSKGTSEKILFNEPKLMSRTELILAGSYPTDYKFINVTPDYLVGMSVPPIMTAQIAKRIYDQVLSKL